MSASVSRPGRHAVVARRETAVEVAGRTFVVACQHSVAPPERIASDRGLTELNARRVVDTGRRDARREAL